ncbi:TRAP transporter permease [Halopenitus persicus]|uniref:TRAP transporter, 4TM/12TM fusion protein n=1 Tax=Halopenitus persicus TaxID=1048396 RepID=A0A1H3FP99_9EURY|nr:TRAP transporter fused permease subunit [Halopenitus persicus]SDX92882.1 TRAP transporter, 4TM/12TM fusion protein [Halopenitus persicus]
MSTRTDRNGLAETIRGGLDVSVTVAAVVFWLIVLVWAHAQRIPLVGSAGRVQFGVVFVGGIMTVYALDQTRQSLQDGNRIDGAVLLASSIVLITSALYFALNFELVYLQRQGYATPHEYMLARLVIVSILYLTWREFGNLFLGVVGGMIIYGVFGNHVSGVLGHAGMQELTLLQVLVTDLYGFYGSLTQLTAAWIAPFLLYAGLLFGYGAFDLILRVAIVTSSYIKSGVAQTAVLSSAVIGSINGSYTANAAMTGSFTIPTMRESGMANHRAGAIEAVASTSGQVLPPVMGASAFVMASYLGVQYLNIIVAGLVPAAILVASIGIAVHYTAISDASTQDMQFSEFFEETLSRREKAFEGLRFGIPFVILVYLLGIVQWTVMTAALWTIVAMVITGITFPVIQRGIEESAGDAVEEFVTQFWDTVTGFRRGAIILAPIAIILVSINGVINILSTTGVPNKIALLLIDLSGGVLLYAVLLGMAVAILMGMGMPTVASYVIVAILIAPTFVADFGVPEIVAHYTVFYAAILAGITPPVATAAVVAAGIAEANFWRTCGVAIKIAAPLFVLPIAFVYNPGLVTMAPTLSTLFTGVLVLVGAVAMIYGLNYPFRTSAGRRVLIRGALFALGLLVMVYPGRFLKVAGIVAFGAVFAAEKVLERGAKLPFRRGVER